MEVIEVNDYQELSKKGARFIADMLKQNPSCTLGLATGATPKGLYQNLIKMYENGSLDFTNVKTVNLDEYKGLSKDHIQSYNYYMHQNFFSNININESNVHLPDGTAENPKEECKRYDQVIQSLGGIDLQLLGIGQNGHIGFNEPSDCFSKGTYCVKLSESTKKANSRYFQNESFMPSYAFTMGIGSIMGAKQILLLASGKNKAAALKAMIEGPVTPKLPASILQFHPSVTIIADKEALGK